MDYTEKKLRAQEIFRGRIVYLHKDVVRLPDGREAPREIVEHSGGVTVIPVDGDGNVYCVRQFRYAYGAHLLETPAGKLEPGEDPLACAKRELSEETGFTAERYIDLGCIYPSPGYCKETIYVYLATGLVSGKQHLDEGEFLEVEKYPLKTLLDMVMRNEIRDAKTAVGILKAQRYLEERNGT